MDASMDLATLPHLQALDQERDEKRRRLEKIALALSFDPKLAATRAARDDSEKQLALLHTEMQDAELAAKSLDGKINELGTQLASGRVRNPKELEALERDRQMHLRHRSEMDTRLLELMEAVDRTQKQAIEKEHALRKSESLNLRDSGNLGRERDALKARLSEIDSECAALRAELGADAVAVYDRLRQSKAGRALSHLKDGGCSVCGVQIPLGLVARVENGEEMIFCPDCGRIIVA